MKLEEVPSGWFHLYVGEAQQWLTRAPERVRVVVLYPRKSTKRITARQALRRLSKCECSATELMLCTCLSFLFQDKEGVYHYMTSTAQRKRNKIRLQVKAERKAKAVRLLGEAIYLPVRGFMDRKKPDPMRALAAACFELSTFLVHEHIEW